VRPKALILLVSCMVVASCTTFRLVPQADEDTTVRYNRGNQIANALKDRVGVSVSTDVVGNLIYFHIIVKNFREQNLYVDDTSAQLTEEGLVDPFTDSIRVYRADEYYQKRHGEIVAGQVLMALSAVMSTANAGRSTSHTTVYYGRNRYYRGYGTYSYTTYTYDSARAAMEREVAFANVRDYVNGTNMELEYLQNTLFYPSDVDPGDEYYGIIISEFGKTDDSKMTLSLVLGSVPFRFTFEKQKLQYGGS
jgi:hypothetical protein